MTKNDNEIKLLLEQLTEKKLALGKKPTKKFKTNGVYKQININTLSFNSAIDLLIQLRVKYETINQVPGLAEELHSFGVNVESFEDKDYIDDVRQHINFLLWNEKINEINKLEARLHNLFSEDTQTKNALKEIQNMLGSI